MGLQEYTQTQLKDHRNGNKITTEQIVPLQMNFKHFSNCICYILIIFFFCFTSYFDRLTQSFDTQCVLHTIYIQQSFPTKVVQMFAATQKSLIDIV